MKKRIITIILVFSMLCTALPMIASAATVDSGTCGENLTWMLDANGVLTVSGTGEMYDYSAFGGIGGIKSGAPTETAPWMTHMSAIEKVVIEEGVTSVGNKAFAMCDGLTAVTLPDSLKRIGREAFYGCWLLQDIDLPEGLTTIDIGAFYSCDLLTAIRLPESLAVIGDSAFGFSGLTAIEFPDNVTTIGYGAFSGCMALTEVTIPGTVKTVGEKAFSSCSRMTSVTIGEGVESIGASAFAYCDGLTEIEIPNGIKALKSWLFESCDNLKSVTIPVSVTTVEVGAFDGCKNLTDVYYGGTQEQWDAISVGSSNRYLTNAAIHFAGAEQSLIDEARLDVGNSLSMQFAVPKAKQADWTGFYAQVDHTRSDGSVKTTKIPYTQWYVDTQTPNYLVISYSGVAAKEMTDEVKVTIFDASGKQVGAAYTDSIRGYIMRNFGKFGAKVDRLFADMLNYGAEAQKYFHNKENDLANALMNETQKGYATQTDPAVTNTATAGIQARLDLQYKIALQIAIPEQYKDQTITYSFINQKGVASGEITAPVEVDRGVCLITVDAIVVGDARQTVTVKANGEEIFHDSVESYIARMSNTSDMADLCKAIMKFADAARDYFK